MHKAYIYYAIMAAGALAAVVAGVAWLWPERGVPAAAALEQTILGDAGVDTKQRAARDIARHGTAARLEVRRSLQRYRGDDPQVKVSLIDATAGNQDWRSLPDLFRAMESSYPVVRARAAKAAEKIMGIEFFYRADDPPQRRAAIVAQMRSEYDAMVNINRFQNFYRDQTD